MMNWPATGTLNGADVYGQQAASGGRPDILAAIGPNQSATANASVNLFGSGANLSAPAWAFILLVLALLGVRIAFEFSSKD